MPIIKYKNVDINIDSKVILEDVSFTLETGEFAYIIGAVGSGKSTLLKTIYGEVDVADGKAYVMDEYDMSRRVYNFTKYLKKLKLDATYYALDNIAFDLIGVLETCV